tara:strand:- start:112 stop:423 length:312 start_codon:yes stop_codon:yes gene_type:complete
MATLRTNQLHDNKHNLSVQTWTNKQGVCYAIFNDENGKEIKRTFGGFAPNQHRLADAFAQQLQSLTGCARWVHLVECDRTHRNASSNCNGNLTEEELRELNHK